MTAQADRPASAPVGADGALHLSPARREDFEAVATLFEALHAYNASLNERFALAPQWRPILFEHFQQTVASDRALWLLAWKERKAVGLLVLEQHLDSPLFLHRRRIELVALYVAPDVRRTGLARWMMHV